MSEHFPEQQLIDQVLRIVREAGEVVMGVYRRAESNQSALGVQHKDDNSPVTEADLRANAILTAALKAMTPGIPVVSEEDPHSHSFRRRDNQFWLLDPVDGTREFINRTGEFTVNVALLDHGYPVLGVVQAPAMNELFWGSVRGAWCDVGEGVKRLSTRAFPRKKSDGQFSSALRIVASRSHMNAETRAHIASMQPQQLVGIGSSLKFCRIAQGKADYYPRLGPTCEWDTAAAQAVVEAAGGQVLTLGGERLSYGKPDVLNPHFIVTGQGAD